MSKESLKAQLNLETVLIDTYSSNSNYIVMELSAGSLIFVQLI